MIEVLIRLARGWKPSRKLSRQPEIPVTTLPTGLRVVTLPLSDDSIVTLGVWINAGSRFDVEGKQGIGNFLRNVIHRHKALIGMAPHTEEITKKTSYGSLSLKRITHKSSFGISQLRINDELIFHTKITRKQVAYYATVEPKDVKDVLEILSCIVQDTNFNDDSIERARNTILRQMDRVKDRLVRNVILDLLHSAAFGNSSLGNTIWGSAEDVKSITQDQLKDYMASRYTASRMVLVAAGQIEKLEVVEMAKKLFNELPSDPTTGSQLVLKSPALFTGSEIRIIDDSMKFAHFALAFEGASATDPDLVPLMIVKEILREKTRSPLLLMSYAVNAHVEVLNINYEDSGLFGLYVIARPNCLGNLSYALMETITRLTSQVTNQDIELARFHLKNILKWNSIGAPWDAKKMARQVLDDGKIVDFENQLFPIIDSVTVSTVRRVARRFIFSKNVALAAKGPVQRLAEYDWFRSWII